ncbi:MAG: aldehyde:ferredoxin oxidoreductase [Chloroflexi bacterium]|nr:aldehyde:ferredoxin oxidoreductase [Chloroflexota bacterium]
MLPNDPISRVLYIDLTKKTSQVVDRSDLFEAYIGGAGVAAQLLLEECPPGIDAFDPRNPIILAVGPLVGNLPLASKTVAMFKSPHTGNLGESHAGGRSAVAIRMAGYGAIVIKGASETPLWVSIDGDEVHLRDATTLWGLSNTVTGRVVRENEGGAGLRTILRIGRAGEQMLPYANVMCETYRHFGRIGLGAVFGSKKLKALVVSGKRSLPVADRRAYRQLYDEIYQQATTSKLMKKYHDLGTASNILPLNAIGGLPTRNLQAGRIVNAERISGEAFAEGYLGRRLACTHCPVGCIHIAALREPYENEPYFMRTRMVAYDYEPIFALGSMLGINEPRNLLRLLDRIDDFGLDCMSAGVVLAWATEAVEKGLIPADELDGVSLRWGGYQGYLAAAERLLSQPTPFYQALARGVDYASSVYGGREFALAYGGNEIPGYHTGPAAHLGFLLGARHSHLDNAGYSVDQKEMLKETVPPERLINMLLEEEGARQILSSLVVCFFARNLYDTNMILRSLEQVGMPMTAERLAEIGRDIWRAKYQFKLREGFDLLAQTVPQRIYETDSALGPIDETYMQQAIAYAANLIGELAPAS